MSAGAPRARDRVFLDANLLFSSAYREEAGLRQLWERVGTQLLTSAYALEETRRNLENEEQLRRLNRLIVKLELVPEATGRELPPGIVLPEKDRPILQAALEAAATHLLTGDVTDFGPLFGTEVEGMRIERPAAYLRRRSRNSDPNEPSNGSVK